MKKAVMKKAKTITKKIKLVGTKSEVASGKAKRIKANGTKKEVWNGKANWISLWSALFGLSRNSRTLNIAKNSRLHHVKQRFSMENYKNTLWDSKDLSDTQLRRPRGV